MPRVLKTGGKYEEKVIKELMLSELTKRDFRTVKELIHAIQRTTGIPEAVLIQAVNDLENEGRVDLYHDRDQKGRDSFSVRLSTNILSQLQKYDYVIISLIFLITGTVLTLPSPLSEWVFPLRILLGGALILVFPGYAVFKALFPQANLYSVENILVYVGSSFVISSLIIFSVATLGLNINELTVFLAISVVTFISLIIGVYRSRIIK